jgi:hypothetical protein
MPPTGRIKKPHSKGCGGKQERSVLIFRRKEQARDNYGKKSKLPFERIANHGGGDFGAAIDPGRRRLLHTGQRLHTWADPIAQR